MSFAPQEGSSSNQTWCVSSLRKVTILLWRNGYSLPAARCDALRKHGKAVRFWLGAIGSLDACRAMTLKRVAVKSKKPTPAERRNLCERSPERAVDLLLLDSWGDGRFHKTTFIVSDECTAYFNLLHQLLVASLNSSSRLHIWCLFCLQAAHTSPRNKASQSNPSCLNRLAISITKRNPEPMVRWLLNL